jgi:tetratricopeptide (TPR) repeat protein
VLLAAALPAPCIAAGPTANPEVRLASGLDVLRLAEAATLRGDSVTAERALRALFADPSAELRAEARFRLAQLLAQRGKASDAAVLLRQLVDEHPNAGRARLELAGLLHKLGEEESALRQIRALQSMNLPAPVANFVDRVSASLYSAKPFGLYAEVALAPDSNINRATTSDTLGTVIGDFTVDETSKARAGIGAAVRTVAHARRDLGSRASLAARASSEANIYGREQFNLIQGEISAGPEFDLGSRRISLTGGLGRSWYGMKPFSDHKRLSASVAQRIGPVSQLRLDASLRWSNNALNALQDGQGTSFRLGFERALSPRLFVTASAALDRFQAQDAGYSTRSTAFGASVYREAGRTTLSLGADVGCLKADERLMLFPERREEKFARIHFGGVFRQMTVRGFAPMARVSIERNRSTIELHDYSRTRTELGITRSF